MWRNKIKKDSSCVTLLLCDPGWCAVVCMPKDVFTGAQNRWDEKIPTHTHAHRAKAVQDL